MDHSGSRTQNENALPDLTVILGEARPDTDFIIRGLERKLDVLRAQLAAAQAGEDIGEAGIQHWRRLEVQSQRIEQLERENFTLRQKAIARELELERARAEIQLGEGLNLAYGRALAEAASLPLPVPQPALPVLAEPLPVSPNSLMLAAMLNSTSWRVTAPLRALGEFLKRIRGDGS